MFPVLAPRKSMSPMLSFKVLENIAIYSFDNDSNGNDSLSNRASIFQLWRVSTRFPMPFRDTWKISTGGIKTKPSNEIEFCQLLHACLVKGELATVPITSFDTILNI